uniref:Uncharacterized protein n=1 Tax=Arundo donax TaxID=35708 RepID=A0A0A9BN98_ARUDO
MLYILVYKVLRPRSITLQQHQGRCSGEFLDFSSLAHQFIVLYPSFVLICQ